MSAAKKKMGLVKRSALAGVDEHPIRGEAEETAQPAATRPTKSQKNSKSKAKAARAPTAAERQEMYSPQNLGRTMGRAMLASLQNAKDNHGRSDLMPAVLAHDLTLGLGLPALSLELLFQCTILPFQRVIQIVGAEGSAKTALAFEMGRWFRESSGLVTLQENESKFSDGLAMSIMNLYDDPMALTLSETNSVEEWQEMLQLHYDKAKKLMLGSGKKDPGSGRTWPYLQILDSVYGKLALETIEKIEKAGYAERGHPLEAMKITRILQKIPSDLRGFPFGLVVINHLKPGNNAQGQTVRNKPGGKHVAYQSSFEIEMTKLGKMPKSPNREGLKLLVKCWKNGFGTTGRTAQINLLWRYKEVDGQTRQITWFDWDAATIRMLTHEDNYTRTKEIVDLTSHKGKYHSKRLKVSKDDPLSPADMGKLLFSTPDVRDELRAAFGVAKYNVFEPGVDYLKQVDVLRREAERKLRARGVL